MGDEDTERQILEYIKSHRKCTIAIADGSRPIAYTMFYVNSGMHIFFESDPTSQKVAIMRANPKISLTIDDDTPDWSTIKGLQLFGTTSLVAAAKSDVLRKAYLAKFPSVKALGGIPETHAFIMVRPELIYFLDFSKGFGHRTVYHLDQDYGKSKPKLSW
jgi:uncharacterized protein YhbP (UPF0306 family)